MKFVKYPSIENHYREKFIHSIQVNTPSDIEWVATEKLHGANLGIWCNGDEVKFSRRSGFIPEGEKFYQLDTIRDELEENVMNFYRDSCVSGEILTIYGELVGEGVQKDVSYAKGNDFIAFDVMINDEFYPFSDTLIFDLNRCSIKTVPVIFRGSLKECLELDNEFNSLLQSGDESFICEGLVIKPLGSLYQILPSGSRAIIKSKNEKFSEVSKKPKSNKPAKVISGKSFDISSDIELYLTENRLSNVISKHGEFENKMFGKIMYEFILDAIEDWCKDNERDWNLFEKTERKDIQSLLVNTARDMVKKLL